jgi:nucleoside-diphosphate-sugar epimerase
MEVLVTGGTGFIGSHLMEKLVQKGHHVSCVAKDRMNSVFLESLDVEVVLGDLNNGMDLDSMLESAECIYHLAGAVRARSSKDFYEGNYLMTKNFINICARSCKRLKRFVYVSSLAAAGPSVDGRPVKEEDPFHPVSHYGRSKMLAELEVLHYSDRMPISIVRPSGVYGPRDREMLQYFLMIKKNLQLLIGFGRKWLNLTYVDDIVNGLLLAGEHPKAEGETFFIGNERSYPVEEIGNTIACLMNCKPIRIHMPHLAAFSIGIIAESIGKLTRRQIFFNFQKAKESVQTGWIISVDKARSKLGYRPRVSITEGMKRTYEWYRENGWLN